MITSLLYKIQLPFFNGYKKQIPDVLIVLGKNIGIGSNKESIRKDFFHLSKESRMNVVATGILYKPSMKIILSSGHTACNEIISEAQAMKNYCNFYWPHIPDSAILLEEKSLNTAGNAEEVAKIIKQHNYKRIGLITVGYHLDNAKTLFESFGIPISCAFASEIIESRLSKFHKRKVDNWLHHKNTLREYQKEKLRKILLKIDPKGKFIQFLTKITRG